MVIDIVKTPQAACFWESLVRQNFIVSCQIFVPGPDATFYRPCPSFVLISKFGDTNLDHGDCFFLSSKIQNKREMSNVGCLKGYGGGAG